MDKKQAALACRKTNSGPQLLLPSYSPNLNLIERLWKFIKCRAIYGRYHPTFADFRAAVEETIAQLPTTHASRLASPMTLNFQQFENVSLMTLLFRTRPAGSRLLVIGPANSFKANAHPLTALIETDWLTASFTMNWKIMTRDVPVMFEAGEPLLQAIPLANDVCGDLEGAAVRQGKLAENPEIARLYHEWSAARNDFHRKKAEGLVSPDAWQKEYFQGRDPLGRPAAGTHTTRIQPPKLMRDAGEP